MRIKITFPLLIFYLMLLSFGFTEEEKNRSRKINTNGDYEYIAINNIMMWISNDGAGSHRPQPPEGGFYWPGGIFSNKIAVFKDGLLFGGIVGNQMRVNGNTYREGLQAGKIINGTPDDPSREKYRVYKITRGWEKLPPGPERDAREKDYNEWPIEDGAPYVDVDGDGKPTPGIDKPDFIGDEVLWYVANDMDPVRSTSTYGTLPIGLEFQTTVFGFDKINPLGDIVFKKYKIINKGPNTVNDMIVAYWSDTDIGNANDDYSGCDTVLSLGYTWNGTNNDEIYGTPPPAMGYVFVQGPVIKAGAEDTAKFDGRWRDGYKNLPMTAFGIYIPSPSPLGVDPSQGVPEGSIQMYHNLRGYSWDGSPYINPLTGEETKFLLTGDPENGTGWYEGDGWPSGPYPSDRRLLISSGSFNFAPGDTQEVVIALMIAEGENHKNSVTELKKLAALAQTAYNNDFKLTALPDKPSVHTVLQNREVTLWWETNAENFSIPDPLIPDTIRLTVGTTKYVIPVPDKNYKFEGYRIWQFKDKKGTDPVLLAVYDIQNGVASIRNYTYEYALINGLPVKQELFISGPDQGLRRLHHITSDVYTGEPLYNGSPYYFGITSYAYSKFSDPPAIESEPDIIEVIPGVPPIDVVYSHNSGEVLTAVHSAGTGLGDIKIKIVDPVVLTGHQYRVTITGDQLSGTLRYTLTNLTLDSVLLADQTNFGFEFDSKPITDGFQLSVQNAGWDSILAQPAITLGDSPYYSMVKDVLEVFGPGGAEVNPPRSVMNQMNSTNEWQIRAPGQSPDPNLTLDPLDHRQNIDWTNNLRFNDYEIRFTGNGSEYYLTGYSGARPPTVNNQKGDGRVPFEIWDVGGYNLDEPAEVRHLIKVWDASIRDSVWSQNPTTQDWEAIFSYTSETGYSEPLPQTSGTVAGSQHKLGNIIITGNQPADGTVIKIVTFKPLSEGDSFDITVSATQINPETAKQNINNISVFPNPYYAAKAAIGDHPPYLRFTNLPEKAVIRIFSLGGVYITKLEKDERGQYIDWNLTNKDNYTVASGIYLAYIELPGIGTKVMKIAVVQ